MCGMRRLRPGMRGMRSLGGAMCDNKTLQNIRGMRSMRGMGGYEWYEKYAWYNVVRVWYAV